MLRRVLVLVLVSLLFASITFAAPNSVIEWNQVLLDAVRADRTAPPRAARAMAITHLAILAAAEGAGENARVAPFGGAASVDAAVVAAAHRALVELFPAQAEACDRARDAALARIPDDARKTRGVSLGRRVAGEILMRRRSDHSSDVVGYSPGTGLGDWRPTPPLFAPALLPQWPNVTPFVMNAGSQFRKHGPPALDTAEWNQDLQEVLALGAQNSTTRSPDQTEIALFWADGPGTDTPPGHWNAIAARLVAERDVSVRDSAKLFAVLNAAMADAAIAAWDMKYAYGFWRPVTAIRELALDPTWTPLITTPPFPEYVSGHSTFSGAGARVLELYFGTDELDVEATSDAFPGVVRSFHRLSDVASEAGRSRIYGGIHFEFSNREGIETGREIAELAWTKFALGLGR